MSGQEYVRQWVSASNDYLVWIWNTLVDNWLLFWNSDLFKELTKPHVLKLFGLSAALGILLPIIIMLGWRFLTRRNSQKSTYEKVEDDAIGSFNAKVINSIKSKPKKNSKKDFDKIPKNPKNEHVGKKPTTSFDNSESSPLLEDDALTADDEQSVTEKDESRIKKTEHMNSTRIMPDFTLKDGDIEELSHMKFHGKLKSATLRARANKLEENMSAEERENERRLKMEQLESIFQMMQKDEKFGIHNKDELMDQFKFYN